MECKKKSKRGLDNLFKYYDCNNCKYYLEDEMIMIGNDAITIYYMSNRCSLEKDKLFINNQKSKLLMKDIYLDRLENKNSKNIFLWLNKKDDLHLYYDDIAYFLENNYKIYIVI